MAAVSLSPILNGWQGFTPGGLPLSLGKIYSYLAGSSTPAATYTTSAGNVANANPMILGPDGRPQQEIWLVDGTAYRFVLQDSLGTQIEVYDNVWNEGSMLRADLADTTDPTKGAFQIGRGFPVVDSIAALRACLRTNPATHVFVTSYYGDGNGGGGPLSLDDADTVSPDNGVTTFVAADGGRWKRPTPKFISAKEAGARGDDATDDSSALAAADAAAVAAGVSLYVDGGIFRCKAITLHDIRVDGVIKATGTTSGDAVVLAGAIDAPDDRKIFDWTAADPTNLPGTSYPFLFSTTATFGSHVSVKWFGATGDNVTDDSRFINSCATAMSKSQIGGTPYATKRGPVEMWFPRGNYRIGKDSTINITTGTVMTGQASGSNPLSTLIKDDVTYGAGASDMIWVVGDNVTHTDSAAQMVVNRLSFIWRPTIDYASSTAQLDTAFFAFKALCIDAKFHDCWFLGAPQKGALFSWGNKYTAALGGGLQKTNTGSDSDGLQVSIHLFNSFVDVCYGTIATVLDKGYGAVYLNSTFIYQLWLGFGRNYSTHSTGRLAMTFNVCQMYGICAAASATVYDPDNHSSTITWGQVRYRNMDIAMNSPRVTNAQMSGINFFWQAWLQNSTLDWSGGSMDSTDTSVRFYWPLFSLDYYVNSLSLRGVKFMGAMTPNSGISSQYKSIVTKGDGSISLNGITSKLAIIGNEVEAGSVDWVIFAGNTYSEIDDTEIMFNTFNCQSTRVTFGTTGKTLYHVDLNKWSNYANVLTP